MTELRILIIAEHASAKFGGEAILPLHYFRLLRQRGIQAWLVVHARTRNELLELFPADAERIHFVPDTKAHKILLRLGRLLPPGVAHHTTALLMRLSVQFVARRKARRLIRQHNITLVHQPIPVSPKDPSVMYGLGVPVLFGPMNGGMSYPPGFKNSQGLFARIFQSVGRRLSHLVHRILPGKLKAKMLLVANQRTKNALPHGIRAQVRFFVENGVDLTQWQTTTESRNQGANIRFVFIGRLVAWKAVDLLLEAFRTVAQRYNVTLDILGEGRQKPALMAQCQRDGLEAVVNFRGWLSQANLAAHLRTADVLVLPSLFECGGAVVLEAMAASLPVIATNWGGPADYLDANCGILVDPTSPAKFVDGLVNAMCELAESPEKRLRLGRAGRERVAREFDWERKIESLLEIYRSIQHN